MRKHRREKQTAESTVSHPSDSHRAGDLLPQSGGQASSAGSRRVGGYCLVRILGEGQSATVYLGHADTGAVDEPQRTAAIKIYRSEVPLARIDAEIAALTALEHSHVVRLLDLTTTDDGRPCLVLERCAANGLARLVSDRRRVTAGEAVTILAPLVGAVQALHWAGLVHRDIRLSAVLFRDDGAPVLAGLGHSAALSEQPSRASLAGDPDVLADRRQLVLVVRAILQLVDDPGAKALDERLATATVSTDDFCEWLSDTLFGLAEPRPVGRSENIDESWLRVVRPQAVSDGRRTRVRSAESTRLGAIVRGAMVHARGVRRRIWFIAGGVALSLVVAAVAIPPTQHDDEVDRSLDGNTSKTAPTASARPTSTNDPPANLAVLGDDPVAALVALLDERQRCLHDLSVVCLEGVLQKGSAALQRDEAVIRALQAGGVHTADDTIETTGPVLVERLGDSALLDLGDVPQTQPASTLMMRGEAGWRIRDYLDDG